MPELEPGLRSLALDALPQPDFADVHVVALPPGASTDPRVWAARVFALDRMPVWVGALMGLRQRLVRLIGVEPGRPGVFDVDEVVGEEALIDHDDRHLRFCCAVGVDPVRRLLRVTTAVGLKGWRGRLYFAPVSLLHGPVVRAMMLKAVRHP